MYTCLFEQFVEDVYCTVPLFVSGEVEALELSLLAEDKMVAAHHQQTALKLVVDLLLEWGGGRKGEWERKVGSRKLEVEGWE